MSLLLFETRNEIATQVKAKNKNTKNPIVRLQQTPIAIDFNVMTVDDWI